MTDGLQKMTNDLQKLLAACALVATCEKLVASGNLPEADEQNLRLLIVKAYKAFEILPLAERGAEVVPFPGSGISA